MHNDGRFAIVHRLYFYISHFGEIRFCKDLIDASAYLLAFFPGEDVSDDGRAVSVKVFENRRQFFFSKGFVKRHGIFLAIGKREWRFILFACWLKPRHRGKKTGDFRIGH